MDNGLLKEADSFESKRADLVRRLRSRLQELDKERAGLQARLRQLEAGDVPGGNGGRTRALRSEIAKLILRVVGSAGPTGLSTQEIVRLVHERGRAAVGKEVIGTYLSRLRRRGLLRAEGEPGFFRYHGIAQPEVARA